MSRENVEIVRRFYDAWGARGIPGPVEFMHPEIEFVNPVGAVEPGTRSGIAAFSRAVEKSFEGFEAMRGSRSEVEGRVSALWTLRDSKVVRYTWFLELDQALEAAGLSE